jgi:hypothetical protein
MHDDSSNSPRDREGMRKMRKIFAHESAQRGKTY